MTKRRQVLVETPSCLADVCPRRNCGLHLTTAICEHMTVRTCAGCGYECKEVDGMSKLMFHEAIGGRYITRDHR